MRQSKRHAFFKGKHVWRFRINIKIIQPAGAFSMRTCNVGGSRSALPLYNVIVRIMNGNSLKQRQISFLS